MVTGGELPADGYLKAGRFRAPFDLRLDDHAVGTRSGFPNFQSRQRFPPYDSRHPDLGVELGAQHGGLFARAALANGAAARCGPAPFTELRWTIRSIDPTATAEAFGTPLETPKLACLQIRFSS